MNTKQAITIELDIAQLRSYTDEFLATLWHVAQANPAPHGDREAGEIASQIGAEIVRRWLGSIEPAMHHHQQRDYYWTELRRFARFESAAGGTPGRDGRWVPRTPGGGDSR